MGHWWTVKRHVRRERYSARGAPACRLVAKGQSTTPQREILWGLRRDRMLAVPRADFLDERSRDARSSDFCSPERASEAIVIAQTPPRSCAFQQRGLATPLPVLCKSATGQLQLFGQRIEDRKRRFRGGSCCVQRSNQQQEQRVSSQIGKTAAPVCPCTQTA